MKISSKTIKTIVFLFGVIGLILILWGVSINYSTLSEFLLAFGAGILGASISTFFGTLSNAEIIDALNPLLKNDIISEESNLKAYRKNFHFYWITKIDKNPKWYHSIINFSDHNVVGRLKGEYHVITEQDNSLKYFVNGGLRGKVLILSIEPVNSKEPEIVALFPDFGLEFIDQKSGIVFHQTYDGLDLIASAIICRQPIGNMRSIGFVTSEIADLLTNIWSRSKTFNVNIGA
jgi:hypothetical protein